MLFYMVRDKRTGLFYKRGHAYGWVEQEEASVWTTSAGPQAALGGITRRNRRKYLIAVPDPEIITIPAKQPKVVYVHGDDWAGLYLDGVLVEEGHHIRLDDIFRRLGIPFASLRPNTDWLEDRGRLPESLGEVVTA